MRGEEFGERGGLTEDRRQVRRVVGVDRIYCLIVSAMYYAVPTLSLWLAVSPVNLTMDCATAIVLLDSFTSLIFTIIMSIEW